MDLLSSEQEQNLCGYEAEALFKGEGSFNDAIFHIQNVFSRLSGNKLVRVFSEYVAQLLEIKKQKPYCFNSDYISIPELFLKKVILNKEGVEKLETNKQQFIVATLSLLIHPRCCLQEISLLNKLTPSQTLRIVLQAIQQEPDTITALYENTEFINHGFHFSLLKELCKEDPSQTLLFLKRSYKIHSSQEICDGILMCLASAENKTNDVMCNFERTLLNIFRNSPGSDDPLIPELDEKDQDRLLQRLIRTPLNKLAPGKRYNLCDALLYHYSEYFTKITPEKAFPYLKLIIKNKDKDRDHPGYSGSFYFLENVRKGKCKHFERLNSTKQNELLVLIATQDPEAFMKENFPLLENLSPDIRSLICWKIFEANPYNYDKINKFFIYPENKNIALQRFITFLNAHPDISILSKNFYPEIIKAKLEIPDILVLWENEKKTEKAHVLNEDIEDIYNGISETDDNFITIFLIPLINKMDFQRHHQLLIKALEFIYAVQFDEHYTECITDFFGSLHIPDQPCLHNQKALCEAFEELKNCFQVLFLNNPTFVEKFTQYLSKTNQALLIQNLSSKENDDSTVLTLPTFSLSSKEYAVIVLTNVFQGEIEILKPIKLEIKDFDQKHPVLIEKDVGKYETRHLSNLVIHGLSFAEFDLKKIAVLNIEFENVRFPHSNWSGITLNMAAFIGCDLRETNFHAVDAQQIAMVDTNLEGADLSGANLKDGRLIQCNLQGANLVSADLSCVWCSPDKVSNFSNANLSHANLTGAKLGKANFENAKLTGTNCTGAIFEGNLKGIQAQGANFAEADLTIESGMLEGADLRDAILTGASIGTPYIFLKTDLRGANLRGIRGMNKETFSAFLQDCASSSRPLIDDSTLIDD